MRRISLAAVVCLALWSEQAGAQSEPFIGQLMTNGWNFCPQGWAAANGQLLSIVQNQALFALLGTTYGGDGRTTFALPNVRPMIDANGSTLTTCIALVGIFPSRP